MDNLKLEKTKDTLLIDFDAASGILEMAGNSYPENSTNFFRAVFEWMEKYMNEVGRGIFLNCRIDYFNTSTSKCLLEIVDMLEKYSGSGKEVKINWYFKKGDTDTKEAGEELFEDYSVDYEIIEM